MIAILIADEPDDFGDRRFMDAPISLSEEERTWTFFLFSKEILMGTQKAGSRVEMLRSLPFVVRPPNGARKWVSSANGWTSAN